MRASLYLAFSMTALLGSLLSLLILPKYRSRLAVLREARQLSAAEAARKLRSFVLLIGVWFVLGMIALAQHFRAGDTP